MRESACRHDCTFSQFFAELVTRKLFVDQVPLNVVAYNVLPSPTTHAGSELSGIYVMILLHRDYTRSSDAEAAQRYVLRRPRPTVTPKT